MSPEEWINGVEWARTIRKDFIESLSFPVTEVVLRPGVGFYASISSEIWSGLVSWCDMNCEGQFRIFHSGVMFELDVDAVKFKLAFS